jgi:hypothetical protein
MQRIDIRAVNKVGTPNSILRGEIGGHNIQFFYFLIFFNNKKVRLRNTVSKISHYCYNMQAGMGYV